jgi:NAD(P)-dependent dehydrogenase (short-subunit alcohol dehydrogenase family)
VRLTDKVAVVTGGGEGIGREIALVFNEEGAKVVVVDVIQESMEKTVGEIRARGGKTKGVRADVSSSTEVQRAVDDTLKDFETVDILVNNAGIWPVAPLAELREEQWDKVLDTNLKGAFNCMKAVLPTMLAQSSGNIINIASVAGTVMGCPPLGPHVDYAASKAGILGLTRAAALEVAPMGIRVNAIAPGAIMTPGSIGGTIPAQKKVTGPTAEDVARARTLIEGFGQTVPIGRIGEPRDIAKIALFLASDDSAYVTGQMIVADGGWSIQ